MVDLAWELWTKYFTVDKVFHRYILFSWPGVIYYTKSIASGELNVISGARPRHDTAVNNM